MSADELKRRAAAAAVDLVRPEMVLGLGTGSTAAHFIALIGEMNQGMPVLVLADAADAPTDARRAEGRGFLTDPRAIGRYLAGAYGGAGPHP